MGLGVCSKQIQVFLRQGQNFVKKQKFLPFSLFICFRCSKEPHHCEDSFEHPQYMFWVKNKKINFNYTLLSGGQVPRLKKNSCSTQLSKKFILLINVKMPTIVGILTFISMIDTTPERLKAFVSILVFMSSWNFVLSWVEHEKSFITSGPEYIPKYHELAHTVKPVLSGHPKIDKTKVLETNGILMKVESIAECSLGAFCSTFDLH